MLTYAKEEKEFQTRDWSVFPRSTFLQGKYYLTKQRTLLEIERGRLDQIKLSLQNKQSELETLCHQPDAVKKIEEIATGILRKNLRFVRQLEEAENRGKEIIQRINHAKEQIKELENRIACDKVNTRYLIRRRPSLPTQSYLTRKPFNSLLVLAVTTLKWKKIGK